MPDAWDLIVGVPLEDWMRATTVTELDWLLYLRDNPMPRPHPEDLGDTVSIYAWSGELVRTVRV